MAETKKLAIIDGLSVFYRGYYAMPNLSARDGTPTSGVYGFMNLALQVVKKLQPDYVIVAWDKSKTNIRTRRKLYPQYKANRKPMPDDLREQIPVLKEVLAAFTWPLLEVDDFEADDIIATLARQAGKQNLHTLMVTSDLDILQAVDGHSDVYALKRGLKDVVHYDRKLFTEQYGVTPEQFIDIKALKGDSSDNVPGVAGVGEKTANALIQEFGSLERVYENLHKVPDKVRAKLEKDKDMAFLSHKLLEIRFDAPVKLDLKAADVKDAHPEKIAKLFNKLEFRRMLDELPTQYKSKGPVFTKEQGQSTSQAVIIDVKRIETKAELAKFAKDKPKQLLIYTLFKEALVTNINQIQGALLSAEPKVAYLVLPSQQLALKDIIATLKPLLEDSKVAKLGFDIKNDIKAWLDVGVEIAPVSHDVMVGALLINVLLRTATLEQLALDEMNLTLPKLERTTPLEEVTAGMLANALWKLQQLQQRQLSKIGKVNQVATDIEWPLANVLARMEYTGIKLDSVYLKKMSTRFGKRIEQVQTAIFKEAKQEFNISSPAQLSKVLFEDLKLPVESVKKTKTGISTAASELDKLRGLHPIIDHITEYRELTKLKSTYIDPLPTMVDAKGRLHTTFHQIGAQTGRLSSDKPNLMNIPVRTDVGKEIRRAFVAGPGNVLISADYSQFELRLAAVLSGDEGMIRAFNSGVDIHVLTAAEMYDIEAKDVTKQQRYSAKTVNFGVLYGMSAHGLSIATGMPRDQAQAFIDQYYGLRKQLRSYLDGLKEKAHKDGYVETLFGRRRPTPDVQSSNFVVRMAAERAAVNMPLQGTAADLMKLAMIKIDATIDHNCQMLLQIHDSILVECKKADSKQVAKLLKDTMENIHKLDVKLEVDVAIGNNWGEL